MADQEKATQAAVADDGLPEAFEAAFEAVRPRLWGLAYRMLGATADAEDAVQATWIKWRGADRRGVEQPEAWLVTTCTRTCLDLRRAADRARVDYVGLWLPEPVSAEPILVEPTPGPDEAAELASSLTFAFLHLLERLKPAERAAYLLREIFDYDYAQVAATLGKSEAACRQLVTRAKRALERQRDVPLPGGPRPCERETRLLRPFLDALKSGDASRLEPLLAHDVELWTDGGGKVAALPRVLRGPRSVSRFLTGVWRRYWNERMLLPARVNGSEGLLIRLEGRVVGALALAADAQGRCLRIFIQRNPEKLERLQARAPLPQPVAPPAPLPVPLPVPLGNGS